MKPIINFNHNFSLNKKPIDWKKEQKNSDPKKKQQQPYLIAENIKTK